MLCKYGKHPECNKKCRYWIEFEEDDNCSLVAIDKHGEMTLEEIAIRMRMSFVNVLNIERKALKSMREKMCLEKKDTSY